MQARETPARMLLAILVWTTTSTSILGCQELDHPSEVKDLRFLAATLDTPEVILDPAAPGAELASLSLEALVADPRGYGRPLTWSVRACANDPSAPTAPGAGTEASGNYPAGGARHTVGSTRCPPTDGPTSVSVIAASPFSSGPHPLQVPRSLVDAALLSDRFPGHLGHLHGGFDLGLPINLDIQVEAPGTSERVSGIKRVIFWPGPLRADHRPNRNPVITEVRLWRDRDAATLEPTTLPVLLDPLLPGSANAGTPIWIEPSGAEAEPYVTTVLDRLSDQAKVVEVPAENLRFSFFASAGKFVPPETSSTPPFGTVPTARIPLESRYEPPPPENLTLDQTTDTRSLWVTIWIVVRDERGGASFLQRRLRVTE